MASSIDTEVAPGKSDWSALEWLEGVLEMRSVPRVYRVLPIAGLVTIVAVVIAVVGALVHADALAGAAVLVAFATGAAAAGVDSRSRGDWVITPPA
jgi:hypothetical protein